jgi:asparagine synthase (glutamine-hydrolysing)
MYAFAFLDLRSNILTLGRDFFGEKPLYYFYDKSTFIFSSSVLSIKQVIDKLVLNFEGIIEYLNYSYLSQETIYNNLYRLAPNSLLQLDCNTMEILGNISVATKPVQSHYTDDSYLNLIRGSIFNTLSGIERNTAFLLSGGIDSSFIVALASNEKKIACFTASSTDKLLDESTRATKVAMKYNLQHKVVNVDESVSWKEFEYLLSNMSEPFGDSSLLSSFGIYKALKSEFTVAIGGDGGDELFFGYNKYSIVKYIGLINLLRKVNLNFIWSFKISFYFPKWIYKFFRVLTEAHPFSGLTKLGLHAKFLLAEKINWVRNDELNLNGSNLTDFRELDVRHSLPNDMLFKADFSSMINSIELRSPLLNRNLYYKTFSLLSEGLNRILNKKYLKKISNPFLPDGFIDLPKMGFEFSKFLWLTKPEVASELIILNDKATVLIVDKLYAKIFHNFNTNPKIFCHDMYIILILKLWLIKNETNRNLD